MPSLAELSPGLFGAQGVQWGALGVSVARSIASGFALYLGFCLYFEVVYYRRRRDARAQWKSQPRRDAAPRLRRLEIIVGSLNLTMASTLSGLFTYHIQTGGWSAMVLDFGWDRWPSLLVAPVLVFVVVDFGLYWSHRFFHRPLPYKWFHRWHHWYGVPTAFSTLAMHPVEALVFQAMIFIPLLLIPIHVVGAIGVVLYLYWVGICDHSGIRMYSRLPWQTTSVFHDDHHAHFHVNYAHTMGLWDRLFGTWRRVGRRYGAEVFGGRGAAEGGAPEAPLMDYSREALEAEYAPGGSRA